VYDLNELSLKFSRHLEAECVALKILSEDWTKVALLLNDRNVEFHAQYGRHYKTRIPKYGRCMMYVDDVAGVCFDEDLHNLQGFSRSLETAVQLQLRLRSDHDHELIGQVHHGQTDHLQH